MAWSKTIQRSKNSPIHSFIQFDWIVFRNVACEVVSLRQSTNLRTVATMSDKEDEVLNLMSYYFVLNSIVTII